MSYGLRHLAEWRIGGRRWRCFERKFAEFDTTVWNKKRSDQLVAIQRGRRRGRPVRRPRGGRRYANAGRTAKLIGGTAPTTRRSGVYAGCWREQSAHIPIDAGQCLLQEGCGPRRVGGRTFDCTTASMCGTILFVRWAPADSGILGAPCQPSTEIRHDSTASAKQS